MKRNKRDLERDLFGINEMTVLERGKEIGGVLIKESGSPSGFESELVDIYAETIALNQMIADRTMKSIACFVPITNTISSIDSVNIYDPDGTLSLTNNGTFSGEYGFDERKGIDELIAGNTYNKGDLFKVGSVVYQSTVDGTTLATADEDGLADAFFSGKIRYCSEAKEGDIRAFSKSGEVDIKNINFRGRVKSRSAFMSLSPNVIADRLLQRDSHLDSITVQIDDGDISDTKIVRVNRFLLSMAQYIANEKNKDIVHTAICIAKKDDVLDMSTDKSPEYEQGRRLVKLIKDTASSVERETKQVASYVVVSEKLSNLIAVSGLATKYSGYTPSAYLYGMEDKDGYVEPDHIHSNLHIGDLSVVVDKSADFDYYMVGVNNKEYNISGIYVSDQEFILPFKDFGFNIETDKFLNFGSTKLLSAVDPNSFSTKIMALSKYALTLYPSSDVLEKEDLRVQFTDDVSKFANKSELIRFVGVKLPK